jgi:hypothetical protein
MMVGTGYCFLAPGEEGEYCWNATYTLCVDCLGRPHTKATRHAVCETGIYYAVYCGGTVHICDEKQINSVHPDEDNPYVGKWIKNREYIKEIPNCKLKWCSIYQETNQCPIELDVVVEWKRGGSLRVEGSQKRVKQVKWSISADVNAGAQGQLPTNVPLEAKAGAGFGVRRESESQTSEGYMSQDEVYSHFKREQSFKLKPGDSLTAWQAHVEVDHQQGGPGAIFLPIYHIKEGDNSSLGTPPDDINGHCTVSVVQNTCSVHPENGQEFSAEYYKSHK